MNTPKVNEVWKTKSGREVLIVQNSWTNEFEMLWFDVDDNTWTVSPILDRLDAKLLVLPHEFFAHQKERHSKICYDKGVKEYFYDDGEDPERFDGMS